jgi:hypothetical protein
MKPVSAEPIITGIIPVERLEEMVFVDPSLFLDHILVHDRNLARRTAKTDEAEFQPVTECLAK